MLGNSYEVGIVVMKLNFQNQNYRPQRYLKYVWENEKRGTKIILQKTNTFAHQK